MESSRVIHFSLLQDFYILVFNNMKTIDGPQMHYQYDFLQFFTTGQNNNNNRNTVRNVACR